MEALNLMNISKIFKKSKRVLKHLLERVHNRKSKLTDSQKLALVAMRNCNKLVIETERQSGCTVVLLMHAIWHAFSNRDRTVVILSPDSVFLSQTLSAYLDTLFGDMNIVRYISRHEMRFWNGSRILIRPQNENSVRGMAVDLLIVEQYHRFNSKKAQSFMSSILPCMSATRGTIVIETEDELDIPGFTKVIMQSLPKEQPFC